MVEKEQKKASEWDSGNPIQATAEAEAISRINKNTTHKVTYLVRVKDQSDNTKERVLAALKVLEFANYVEVVGIELVTNKTKKTQKIDRYSQVLEKAEEEIVVNIKFPWHTINEIQNVSYQHKKQTKENK